MDSAILKHPYLVKSIPWAIILWTALTFYLTTFPSERIVDVSLFKYDKIGHFLIFGGWTFLLGLIPLIYKNKPDTSLILIIIAGIAFGGFIEFLQYILPYEREASWGDMLANTLGCISAYAALVIIKKMV